jgi:hypothetical protein
MDIKERIDKRFNKEMLNFQRLLEMVEQQLDKVDILQETAPSDQTPLDVDSGKELVLSLPKFSPSENWGDPNSIDRQNVDQLFKVIPGPASLEKKLQYIARIQQPQKGITSPRRIIGSLIILESLNAVINSFGASTSGFIFEGFLAALLGGKQVAEPESAAGGLPIEDIIAFTEYGGRTVSVPMSLKLLKPKTIIKGSYTNLIDALNHYESMVYILAHKTGGDRQVSEVSIHEFVFNQDNFLTAVTQSSQSRNRILLPGMNFAQSLKKLNSTQSWEEKYALLQKTAGYTGKVEDTEKVEKEKFDWTPFIKNVEPKTPPPEETAPVTAESLRKLWDEQVLLEGKKGTGTQWYITSGQLDKIKEVINFRHLGILQVSQDSIYKTASAYLDVLGDTVTDLFSAVASLSDNLNGYFLTKERGKAIARGNDAVEAAKIVEVKATARVEAERGEKEI